MYLLSPFFIMMFKSMDTARVWIIPALVCMISTFLNWYITLRVFPDILDDVQDKWDEKDEINFFYQLYMPTYCRISPYLFGMVCLWPTITWQMLRILPKVV